jgi:hypothetical protein
MTEHYGRVPFTRELIGPYDSAGELRREMVQSHADALSTYIEDGHVGPCPACGGDGILSEREAEALSMALSRPVNFESGYCPLCEASGVLPPFGEA